ncbi:MAG: hypothetical protein QOD06_1661 [Candidatus Binatota bacterium]|nr:hypothetical protein [Candidatus Binatota bacterium]
MSPNAAAPADPYRLIRDTTARLRRRAREDVLLAALPPIAAAGGVTAAGWASGWLAAAVALASGLLAFIAARIPPREAEAARSLDHALAAKEHFLTLVTGGAHEPLRAVVERGASDIARARTVFPPVPPFRWRRILASTAASLAAVGLMLLLAAWRAPAASSLERLAHDLASVGDPAAAALARSLRTLVDDLRRSDLSDDEKRQRVQATLAELERQEGGSGRGEGGGKDGTGSGRQGSGSGRQGTGGGAGSGAEQRQGAGPGAGEREGDARSRQLRDRARGELEALAGPLDGKARGEKRGDRQEGDSDGGGVKAPRKADGAGEGPGEGSQPSGNRPRGDGEAEGEGAGQGQGEKQRPGPEEGSGSAARPEGGGTGTGSLGRAGPDDQAEPAKRYYAPGEGPGGWIIKDGRYVRVRIPDERHAEEDLETVAKPGDVNPETPYGNAALPSAGPVGEAHESQPLPLEYRDALGSRGAR